MAIQEVYHVVASRLPIDPSVATDIPQGRLVGLTTTGNVTLANGTGSNSIWAIGLAGDSRSSGVTSFTLESGSALSQAPKTTLTGALVMGAFGTQKRFTQNRVADNYNEVLASGMMTVYHSGGEFWTSEYETVRSNASTVCAYTPGTLLYASGVEAAGGGSTADAASTGGKFTDEAGAIVNGLSGGNTGQVVGVALAGPLAYPSGVPGTDTPFSTLPEGGNSLSWGQMLHVKL